MMSRHGCHWEGYFGKREKFIPGIALAGDSCAMAGKNRDDGGRFKDEFESGRKYREVILGNNESGHDFGKWWGCVMEKNGK